MVKALLQTVRLLWNMSTYDMTCVCLFQMCCSTNYCIHTHSGLWSLLSPSPLWTTCPSAQWFRSTSQIWVAFTGIACRNNFIHWWLTMIFLLAFVVHFIYYFRFTGCWRCNSNLVHKSWTKGGVNKVSEGLKLEVTLYKFISVSWLLSTHLYQPAETHSYLDLQLAKECFIIE